VRELDLPRFGYQVDAKDPAFFSAFPDGRHFFMWQDRAKTLAEIAKFSRHDAEVYPAYEDQLERISQVVESLLLTTPPQFPPNGIGDFDRVPEAGRTLRGLSAKDTVALVKIFTQSAADLLDEWFESEQVKVTLATDGVIGANGGPRSPGTAYILLHHCMGGVRTSRIVGLRARRHGRGIEAIAASARASGATIRTNAPCRKSWCGADARTAWCWRAARKSKARYVASNLDPKITFLRLLEEKHLAADFVAAIRRFRIEGTSCKINLALNGLPEFTLAPARPGPQHAPPCTSAPASNTWSAPGMTPSTAALGAPAARTDGPDDVRSVARAARQTHHGDLSAVRALHFARGHVGRIARALRRPRDRR
jgi:phytoene dehydrogenase-like protein